MLPFRCEFIVSPFRHHLAVKSEYRYFVVIPTPKIHVAISQTSRRQIVMSLFLVPCDWNNCSTSVVAGDFLQYVTASRCRDSNTNATFLRLSIACSLVTYQNNVACTSAAYEAMKCLRTGARDHNSYSKNIASFLDTELDVAMRFILHIWTPRLSPLCRGRNMHLNMC